MDAPANYRPMDDRELRILLSGIADISDLLGPDTQAWRVREVGDGNLNLVFIVEGADGAVVVKQALPYVRLVGESWPLPLERAWFEWTALKTQAAHAPRLVPALYHHERELALTVMEYLHPHIIMRKGLIRGIEYPRFSADIAEFLATTLFHTSVLGGPVVEHKARIAAFAPNTALCRITEDLVFTDPYREAPLNRWTSPELDAAAAAFRADAPLKRAAQERKWQFMTSAEALIHGDLHTGSVMLTPHDTRVIDPEFAFVGPMGFDIGAVIGNLLLAYFAQSGHESEPGGRDRYREWILGEAAAVWAGFERRFLALWRDASSGDCLTTAGFAGGGEAELALSRAAFMRRLFEDALGFGGLKMIRRILGLAHVEDLEAIAAPDLRARSERRALTLGRELVLGGRRFSGMGDVLAAARAIETEVE